MELSTNIPIAIINEPKDTLCISIFIPYIKISVPRIERTSPLLIPIVKSSTPTTVITDNIKLITKLSIAEVTKSG